MKNREKLNKTKRQTGNQMHRKLTKPDIKELDIKKDSKFMQNR